MEHLKSAQVTQTLINRSGDCLVNRYLKAHAKAWLIFKYSFDFGNGVFAPPEFARLQFVMTEQNIQAVRNQRMKDGGDHEHQDVEPHVLDVQQNAQQVPDSGSDEDDYLPDYQSGSQELPDYQPSDDDELPE